MRRIALPVLVYLMLAGVVGFLVMNAGGSADDEAGGDGGAASRPFAGTEPADELGFAGNEGAALEASADAAGPVAEVAELPGLPQIGSAVVRTARLTIEVREDGFGEAFDTASLVAAKYGGYVESSSTAGTRVRRGDLLIRVPADRFDEAMRDLRALGTVQRQELAGQDVSAEFVDLDARLRTWDAQEAVLLDLMSQATSIEATLRVQRELQEVQLRIEQITGQLRLLENRTQLATIQVSLHEPGAPVATTGSRPSARPSLAEAWQKAVDGFLGVWYAVVVGLGYLVPITALVLIGWVGYRRFLQPRPSAPTP